MMGFQDQQSKRVYIDGHTGPNWAPIVVTKSRLDVEFVKKITLEMVIGQHRNQEGHDKTY